VAGRACPSGSGAGSTRSVSRNSRVASFSTARRSVPEVASAANWADSSVGPFTPVNSRPEPRTASISGRSDSSGAASSSNAYGAVRDTAPVTAPSGPVHQANHSASELVRTRAFSTTVRPMVKRSGSAPSRGATAVAYSSTSSVMVQAITAGCRQIVSGTISIAPAGHSATQMPQPLQ